MLSSINVPVIDAQLVCPRSANVSEDEQVVQVCVSGTVDTKIMSESYFSSLYWSAETVETGNAKGKLNQLYRTVLWKTWVY